MGEQSCEDVNFSKVENTCISFSGLIIKKLQLQENRVNTDIFTNFYTANAMLFKSCDEFNIPQTGKTLPKFLTPNEVESILNNVKIDTPAGYRNRAI